MISIARSATTGPTRRPTERREDEQRDEQHDLRPETAQAGSAIGIEGRALVVGKLLGFDGRSRACAGVCGVSSVTAADGSRQRDNRTMAPCEEIFHIRRSREDDARGIAEVHIKTWRDAYRGQLPSAFLAGLSVDNRERMWTNELHVLPPDTRPVGS